MTDFGMVTTSKSGAYTLAALDSFFRWTELAGGDRFFLIDNDGDFELPAAFSRVEMVRRDEPQSFAANVNFVIKQAASRQADVVFLNNDIIFAPGWLPPLFASSRAILIPMCNQHITYQSGALALQPAMTLDQYVGREDDFLAIVAMHRNEARMRGFARPLHAGFYCFRLPHLIHSTIGLMDEGFIPTGGEDTDYRIRAHMAGFDVAIALDSYVLHFEGKSTWRSGEEEARTRAREEHCFKYFRAKWGDDLASIFIVHENWEEHAAKLGMTELLKSGDYVRVIGRCLARRQTLTL
jgi:GT2 family glycosyltransferase